MLGKTALFVLLATISLVMIPQSEATTSAYTNLGDFTLPPVTTNVFLGINGTVHMLWIVHSAELTGIKRGIWYARYAPNGTTTIPPVLLRNSTTVQSAEMAEDKSGNLHIVWAEGPAFINSTTNLFSTNADAQLYYSEVNSTSNQLISPTPLTGYGKVAMWPSIALDNASTPHLVWMEENIGARNRTLSEYYGTIEDNHLVHTTLLIQYGNQSFLDVPRPRMIYDQAYSTFHIAWTYSQQDQKSQVESQVSYARVNVDGSATHRIEVTKVKEPVNDASVAQGGNGSAYVVWQAPSLDSSRLVYVSKISSEGRVVFLHGFTEPSTSSPYLVTCADSQENLYLVWYQPPPLPKRTEQVRSGTRVSYVRVDDHGSVTDSGNELVSGTVLAIGVSTGGVYAVSSLGIIKVKTPFLPLVQLVTAIAAFSAAGISLTEEGKYRLIRSLLSFSHNLHLEPLTTNDDTILQLLSEQPGSTLRDVKRSLRTGSAHISLSRLTQLESAGYLSSIRVGLTRRFFTSTSLDQMGAPRRIASLILNEIKKTPGTWEGKLAQDLGLSQQIVHYHVRRMRSEGLLDVESNGRRKLYRLANSAWSRNSQPI
jgi:DNA-binding transcriptional ArsR family regulator